MARLENATYEEIVIQMERDSELNGLEEGDDIPVPTMSTAPTATRPGTGLLSSGIDAGTTCNYCKKPGHVKVDCRKLSERRNKNAMTASIPRKSTQSARLVTKQTTRRNGVGNALDDSNNKPTTSILKNSRN